MAARRTTAAKRGRVPAPRAVPVIEVRPLVEDDTEVLAAEHAARDAQLLDLVSRLSA
jgi:hypothetical protein